MKIWDLFKRKQVPHVDRSPDEIRKEILKYLYSKRTRAQSLDEVSVSYKTLKNSLRKIGMTDSEITSNLVYLNDEEFIKENIIKHENEDGQIVDVHYYRISNQGIRFLEGPSEFQKKTKFDGINITNINGAIVVGDGNIIQNQYIELYQSLESLGENVRHSKGFNDEQKLSIQADLDTIKSQLQKLSPDKNTIRKIWEAIKVVVTSTEFAKLIASISLLILKHFS